MTLSEQLPIKMKMHEPNQSFHPFEHIDHSQVICLLAVISYLLKSSDTTYTTTGRLKYKLFVIIDCDFISNLEGKLEENTH